MFNHILLATDNVNQGKLAARTAGATARQMQSANLCIVVTYPAVPDFLGFQESERATAARFAEAEGLMAALVREVGSVPGDIQTEILEGPLAEAVNTVATVRGSDLIVMSSTRPGPWERLVEWFHRYRGVGDDHCPVITMPQPRMSGSR